MVTPSTVSSGGRGGGKNYEFERILLLVCLAWRFDFTPGSRTGWSGSPTAGTNRTRIPATGLRFLAEIMALINALERHGRELGDPECHPVVTARYDLHALRRTSPSTAAPYADSPPVLRVLFGYVTDGAGREIAVLVVGGDKTRLGNRWYPANIARAQDRIDEWCRRNPGHAPTIRRGDLR